MPVNSNLLTNLLSVTNIMILLAFLLLCLLVFVLLNGDWQNGLLVTLLIGFAQDPIRKLAPNQPAFYVGFVLIAFLATAFVLLQRRGGRFDLQYMFLTSPSLSFWLSCFIVLIFLQALNGLLLWDIPVRVIIGVGFYLSPLLGLWLGFHLGLNPRLLIKSLYLYISLASAFAITAFLDYRGIDIPLFQSVGGGQLIHFRYGFYVKGATGLWRSTDLAAMHMTIASCLSVILAFVQPSIFRRNLFVFISFLIGSLTLLTGRRKAIVQIVVFLGLFLWLIGVYGSSQGRPRFFGFLLTLVGIASFAFLLDPSEFIGDNFNEYISRAQSAPNDLVSRFNVLGVSAFQRGLEISRGFGIGVGTLAQTGSAKIAFVQREGFAFVSESGIGKIAAELGFPGVLILAFILFHFFSILRNNLRLVRYLPPDMATLLIGLLSFAISNLPFFSSAAGVYGDPFVLIMCSISLGCFLAVPSLVSHFKQSPANHVSSYGSALVPASPPVI